MNKTTSIYLDLIRFLSAVLVFFFHARYNRFDGAWLESVGAYGHDAVMVFFVLSGFVIAYITKTKESNLAEYSKSRLARLYSVVIPALILTLVLDYFGRILDPSMYIGNHYQASKPIIRFFANLFFINELWFKSVRAFSNGPFWSLSYEFWYYVIFASWFFFSNNKRWIFTALAILIAGPKILILFPVWVMGVVTFHLSSRITINKFIAVFFAIAPFIGYTLFIVGGLVSIHLIGMVALSKTFSFPYFLEKTIRYFSGMTFAFYLFHYPLLQFYGCFIYDGVSNVILTSISIIVIAPFTEGKKREWKKVLEIIYEKLTSIPKSLL